VPSNLEVVRSICADWELGHYRRADWADPGIEYVVADGPDAGEWHGLGGMAEGWRAVSSAWDGVRITGLEIRELDPSRVLALFDRKGRGRTSGIDFEEMRSRGAAVFHLRDGLVRRFVVWLDHERALADLGL
jgi:hypothetical protein